MKILKSGTQLSQFVDMFCFADLPLPEHGDHVLRHWEAPDGQRTHVHLVRSTLVVRFPDPAREVDVT